MFNRILVYFVIPLIFSVCLSISPGNYRFGAYPIQLCSENATFAGYCIDCETELDCHNGANSTTHICTQEQGFAIMVSRPPEDFGYEAYPIQLCSENTSFFGYCLDCDHELDCFKGVNGTMHNCTQDQACRVGKTYAACSDVINVPDCSCPDGQNLKKPDPYDPTKYLICNNGKRYIFPCPENEVYDPVTENCNTPTTTTMTPTTMSGCPAGETVRIKANCTCSRYCFGNGNHYDECCDQGEIYNEEQQKCEFFYPFSCLNKTDGRHVDPHNCSVYYLCVSNETFATFNCPVGEFYDEETQACSQSATCNAVVDCGICPDDKTFIKIDCHNFYECTKNKDAKNEEDLPYVPILDTCPEGTCFNPDTTYCELQS